MNLKYINLFKQIAIGTIGLLGAIFIFILTGIHSTGITPNSAVYISVERNIVAGAVFVTFDGSGFVLLTPLYPFVLGSIKKVLLIEPLISAGILSDLLSGLIVYLSGSFFLKHLN